MNKNQNPIMLKVRKGLSDNHNESTLKVRKGLSDNHNESALKVCKSLLLRGSLLVLALVMGSNAWLHTFQPGMVVPDGPEVTSMAGSDVVPDAPEAGRLDPYKN